MRLHATTFFPRLMLAALLLGGATTSPANAKDPDALTPTQDAQLEKLFAGVDARLDAALSADPKRREAMESDLKALLALPEGKARLEAGRAYRQRHAAYYGAALKRAGVDLAAVARQLQQVLPGHTFQATSDHMILGQFGDAKDQGSTATTAPASSRTIRLVLDPSASANCAGLTTRDIEQTRDFMEVKARAAGAGGCSQGANLSTNYDLTQASTASLAVYYSARVSVEVGGIAGVGMGRANATVTAPSISNTLSVSAVAPLLWYANKESSRSVRLSAEQPVGGNPIVLFRTHASSSGALNGGSHATARMSAIEARLTTTP